CGCRPRLPPLSQPRARPGGTGAPLGGGQAGDGTPLMSGHFLDELRATFAERAGQPAVIYRDQSYTYRELDNRARNAAAWLHGLGVGPGDRVLLATAEKLPFL